MDRGRERVSPVERCEAGEIPVRAAQTQAVADGDGREVGVVQQVVLHRFPGTDVEYTFKCRNKGIDFSPYIDEIKNEIAHLCTLSFKHEELKFLSGLRYIKKDYIDFLRIFRLNNDYIDIGMKGEELAIKIKGPWLHTILFEVPVLAITNQIYFRNIEPEPDYDRARILLDNKIKIVKNNRKQSLFMYSSGNFIWILLPGLIRITKQILAYQVLKINGRFGFKNNFSRF